MNDNCSDFITDKTLLRATSAYGGFDLCPSLSPTSSENPQKSLKIPKSP